MILSPMPDPAKVKVFEDAVDKMVGSLSNYERALLYLQLHRQGMTLNHAEVVVKKGPE